MEPTITDACGHAHKAERPTEILGAEHRIIERVLSALEELTKLPITGSVDRWQKALEFFRHFVDQCHHFKEETVLFPAMETHGIPNENGPIGMMLAEHEEGRAHVKLMSAAVEQFAAGSTASAESLLSHARAYLVLLREHIQKEDDILFRMADEAIPQDEQRQLLRRFEEHEAEAMGAGAHERYLNIARELACPA